MGEIHKTDVSKSPLLQPVIQRDYTKGLNFSEKQEIPNDTAGQPGPAPTPAPEPGKTPSAAPNFDKPKEPLPGSDPGPESDTTKPFEFDEINDSASDLQEGEDVGVAMPAGSARTFANFVGNALQIYLPKATYGYVKIDMDNVNMNIQKGLLTLNYADVFRQINENTEEALKIPDENIKMWKSAFQHYLEYKQVKFANPETEFYAATALLLGDQAVRVVSLKKKMEQLMREALEASNPGMFARKSATMKEETKNPGQKSDIKANKDEAIRA